MARIYTFKPNTRRPAAEALIAWHAPETAPSVPDWVEATMRRHECPSLVDLAKRDDVLACLMRGFEN